VWLTPRLAGERFRRWPNTSVVGVATHADAVAISLSNGESLTVDRTVFATGYKADLPSVPYLASVIDNIDLADGFPLLDDAFQLTPPGLYITGFGATRDFGPFFGFTNALPGRCHAHRRRPPPPSLTGVDVTLHTSRSSPQQSQSTRKSGTERRSAPPVKLVPDRRVGMVQRFPRCDR
jgi:hypothetical protein